MELHLDVYSQSLVLQDTLQGCESVIWERKAFDAGSFQLVALLDDAAKELLVPENIIWIEGENAGIIERIELTANDDGKTTITAKGRLLTSILDRRILWGLYNMYGAPAAIMRNLVSDCCISPTKGTTAYRAISGLSLGSLPSYSGSSIRKQKTGGNLLSTLEEIGEANLTAFSVDFDAENSAMVFNTRYGVDRSVNQDDVSPVFISTDLDEILSSEYTYDSSDYRTCAYIGGQVDDETDTRTYVTVEGSETGLNRRELFVDARDLSPDQDGETLSEAEYEATLTNRGNEKLAEHQEVQSFSAEVATFNATYEIDTDFYLGDTVTLIDERLGITVDAVVTAVQRSVTRNGEQLNYTFGYETPTIRRCVQRIGGE